MACPLSESSRASAPLHGVRRTARVSAAARSWPRQPAEPRASLLRGAGLHSPRRRLARARSDKVRDLYKVKLDSDEPLEHTMRGTHVRTRAKMCAPEDMSLPPWTDQGYYNRFDKILESVKTSTGNT